MNNINWKEIADGTATKLVARDGFLSAVNDKGEYWVGIGSKLWHKVEDSELDTVIATRPTESQVGEIIERKDMIEGMVVKCVEAKVGWHFPGDNYTVSKGLYGDLMLIDSGFGVAFMDDCKFKLVSMPEPNFKATRANLEKIAEESRNTDDRKTVEDAVAWHEDGNEIAGLLVASLTALVYQHSNSSYHFVSFKSDAGSGASDHFYYVCTREEFDACVAAKKAESEWTHVVEDDDNPPTKCRKHLKLIGGDEWVYVCEKGDFFVPAKMGFCSVKPIKPTITRAEAEERLGVTITD